MTPFWVQILGKNDPSTLGAAFVFAIIGVFLTLLWGTTARQPASAGSPVGFSWKYLWNDNLKRIIAVLLMVSVSLRFMPELFNFELSAWHGFIVGISWDGLAFLIKQKTALLDSKPKS